MPLFCELELTALGDDDDEDQQQEAAAGRLELMIIIGFALTAFIICEKHYS